MACVGDCLVSLQVAYVPQTAFIFGETVRNNILFGLPYEEARYQHALDVASLGPDLAILSGNAWLLQHLLAHR